MGNLLHRWQTKDVACAAEEPHQKKARPANSTVDCEINFSSDKYRFALEDTEHWLPHLRQRGYVVIARALSREDTEIAKDLLWKDITATSDGTVLRNDVQSWRSWKLPRTGLVTKITQGAGAWHVRGSAGLKQAFSHIWEASDLIVSMDCAIIWRPWWIDAKWEPSTEGLHLDQNPFSKPGLECVQGMVPLLPVTSVTGGLQVVPSSHTDEAKAQQKKDYARLEGVGDWCPLHRDDDDAVLLLAEAGDLILWDSRTIHGGRVGTGDAASTNDSGADTPPVELARLAVTVAMTPRVWATQACLDARVHGFEHGKNFNHSPHEAGTSTGTLGGIPPANYEPITLTPEQRALL